MKEGEKGRDRPFRKFLDLPLITITEQALHVEHVKPKTNSLNKNYSE